MIRTEREQEMVDGGVDFEVCLEHLRQFLIEHELLHSDGSPAKRFLFVTCGDWDLKTMIQRQCKQYGIEVPPYLTRWVNIKV